jgi:GTPase SAR1 family protein
MGLRGSKNPVPEADNAVDLMLLNEQLEDLFNFKILLLGAGESGKSTVVKQLKLIHREKMTNEELEVIADSLHSNVIDCIQAMLRACEKYKYTLDESDQETARKVMAWGQDDVDETKRLDIDFGEAIGRLYRSQALKKAYSRRDEYWLLDSCSYYMKHLDRFTEIGFFPTEEDCVMARVRTTGIVVSKLEEKNKSTNPNEPKSLKFEVVDVGGQRNERKKWIHCFDDVAAVLFVVNLAGYNQVLFEDPTKNRMQEALELFKEISERPTFMKTPLFVFLNKKDLFESMIKDTDLNKTFPDYKGGKNLEPALNFIKNLFRSQAPEARKTGIHLEVVTSVLKKDIKTAFEVVKEQLTDQNRKRVHQQMNRILKEKNKKISGPTGCFGMPSRNNNGGANDTNE